MQDDQSQPSNPSYQEVKSPTNVTLAQQIKPVNLDVVEGEDSLYPTAVGLAQPETEKYTEFDATQQEEEKSAAMKHYEIDYAKVTIN